MREGWHVHLAMAVRTVGWDWSGLVRSAPQRIESLSATPSCAAPTQVYAASVMFGYFLRRVDTRFQLSKQLGVLPEAQEDAVARLERLFAQVGAGVRDWGWRRSGGQAVWGTRPRMLPRAARRRLQADTVESSSDPDTAEPVAPASTDASTSSSSAQQQQQQGLARRPKSALRRYVESFDQETMLETARCGGAELGVG